MKKVLFLARLFHPHLGGVEKHVWEVSQRLVKKGFNITVITEQFDPELPLVETVDSIEIIRIPYGYGSSKFKLWKWMFDHQDLFAYSAADIVHVHDVSWWLVGVLPYCKGKYFITFHGWEGRFPLKKTAVLQRRLAAKLAMGVIHVGDYISKWYGTKADITTYGGVDLKEQRPTARQVLERVFKAVKKGSVVSSDQLKYDAVFVGRLSTDNDLNKVLELFTIWKNENPKANFVFVGDGELKEACEKIGKVTGFVSDPLSLMKSSKVVCASSYLSIMEAQALVKLVISFYSNPLKQDYLINYPQSKNMVVENSAEKAWERIDQLYSDRKELQYKLKSAQDWAKAQSWEKVTNLYEKLWTRI